MLKSKKKKRVGRKPGLVTDDSPATIIYLGEPLLDRSSSLPESHNVTGRHCFLFGLALDGVYLAK